eukprot:403359007
MLNIDKRKSLALKQSQEQIPPKEMSSQKQVKQSMKLSQADSQQVFYKKRASQPYQSTFQKSPKTPRPVISSKHENTTNKSLTKSRNTLQSIKMNTINDETINSSIQFEVTHHFSARKKSIEDINRSNVMRQSLLNTQSHLSLISPKSQKQEAMFTQNEEFLKISDLIGQKHDTHQSINQNQKQKMVITNSESNNGQYTSQMQFNQKITRQNYQSTQQEQGDIPEIIQLMISNSNSFADSNQLTRTPKTFQFSPRSTAFSPDMVLRGDLDNLDQEGFEKSESYYKQNKGLSQQYNEQFSDESNQGFDSFSTVPNEISQSFAKLSIKQSDFRLSHNHSRNSLAMKKSNIDVYASLNGNMRMQPSSSKKMKTINRPPSNMLQSFPKTARASHNKDLISFKDIGIRDKIISKFGDIMNSNQKGIQKVEKHINLLQFEVERQKVKLSEHNDIIALKNIHNQQLESDINQALLKQQLLKSQVDKFMNELKVINAKILETDLNQQKDFQALTTEIKTVYLQNNEEKQQTLQTDRETWKTRLNELCKEENQVKAKAVNAEREKAQIQLKIEQQEIIQFKRLGVVKDKERQFKSFSTNK